MAPTIIITFKKGEVQRVLYFENEEDAVKAWTEFGKRNVPIAMHLAEVIPTGQQPDYPPVPEKLL